MRTPKKVWRGIARKLKNRKGTTTAKGAAVEEPRTMPEDVKDSLDVKEQKETANIVDKATETDTQLHEDINESREDLDICRPIFESSEKAQNSSIETATLEPNAHSPSPTEPCFDSDVTDKREKPLTTQAIIAGTVGAMLLAGSVAFYALKIHITVAAVVGIVGLACMGFALYDVLKPNTNLEKVEDVEQPLASLESNGMLKNS